MLTSRGEKNIRSFLLIPRCRRMRLEGRGERRGEVYEGDDNVVILYPDDGTDKEGNDDGSW